MTPHWPLGQPATWCPSCAAWHLDVLEDLPTGRAGGPPDRPGSRQCPGRTTAVSPDVGAVAAREGREAYERGEPLSACPYMNISIVCTQRWRAAVLDAQCQCGHALITHAGSGCGVLGANGRCGCRKTDHQQVTAVSVPRGDE